ncbi:hypothetical protein V6N13_065652 [Hibiscus sabdariffa]
MSRSKNGRLVTISTVTCLIKVLGEEGLACFYRMKLFHCKPDVVAYNMIIHALCRVGNFNKASMKIGCRKAIRRRLFEANHLFLEMLFKGFVSDVVTYNCLIDGCCKTKQIEKALDLFEDMNKRNCVPNQITFNSFIRYYCVVNEIDKGIEMMRRIQWMDHGVATNSSYTPIIHALCEVGRVLEATDFLFELIAGDLSQESIHIS